MRLPAVKSLFEIIPQGTEGGKEFGRIVNLLIFHQSRRTEGSVFLFDDAAGDFRGLDSFEKGTLRKEGTTGFQYKFYPSPLSSAHRHHIEESLAVAAANKRKIDLRKWTLVTPHDLLESARKRSEGDVSWFESLRKKYESEFELEHWGHTKLLSMFLENPTLCLFYYPELVDADRTKRKSIADTRSRYDKNLLALYRDIQFVGMSIYKPEAARGVAVHEIYIPLTMVPEGTESRSVDNLRKDTLALLEPGSHFVVLGDPGAGKSTLLRFLALSGCSKQLQDRYGAKPDKRLPVLVVLRQYAERLREHMDLSLLDYIIQSVQADFSLRSADQSFFEYYLESGQASMLFDGLDELPSSHFKEIVRDRIRSLLVTYPGNTAVVTSRIVGYDIPFRFDEEQFQHFRLSALRLEEIEQFVRDWYRVRIDNGFEREKSIADLVRILRDVDHTAIRQLAENPLLLTIVTLVHRIDAVLPDERVILYQKCTETLLNTWHTWKFRETEQKNRGRLERRNRARMEAIAYWMQCSFSEEVVTTRLVVSYGDLLHFLTTFITENESSTLAELEPEDSAIEFLEFIRKRAGLLIESGDKLYSFVHLTFQEYLTATYLITTNEVAGAAGIWAAVKIHCHDPRWHEVIRLLMGGLRSPSSQNLLLERLLDSNSPPLFPLSELLAGFLLDGIEPTETRLEEILGHVLRAAANATTSKSCESLIRTLRKWARKDGNLQSTLESSLRVTLDAIPAAELIALLLMAPACGIDNAWVSDQIHRRKLRQIDRFFLSMFFAPGRESRLTDQVRLSLDQLFDFAAESLLSDRHPDLVVLGLQHVFWRAPNLIATEYGFYFLLTALSAGVSDWMFQEFTKSIVSVEEGNSFARSPGRLDSAGHRFDSKQNRRQFANSKDNGPLLRKAFDELWRGDPRPTTYPRLDKLESLSVVRENLEARLRLRRRGLKLGRLLQGLFEPNSALNDLDEEVYGGDLWSTNFMLECIPKALCLEPVVQWGCALRSGFLSISPNNPFLIAGNCLTDVESRVREQMGDDSDCFYLAWHLIYDSCRNIDMPQSGSLPESVLALSRSLRHPAIRIALAIRSLCLNEEDVPVGILSELANDRDCRRIMFKSGWVRNLV
jgi:hypothetical protein